MHTLRVEKLIYREKKVDAKIKKTESAEERLKMNDLQILLKDTSNVDTRQLQAHEILCDTIKEKYGINQYDYAFKLAIIQSQTSRYANSN